jgi:predicted ATP-dependent endonuclease of OLD family
MRIKRLEYHDHARGWKLESVEFSNLNLLVGVSGAGKTQILNAILNLKKIASGESLNGVEWDVKFLTNDGQEYHWQGEFENKIIGPISAFGSNDSDIKFKLIREKVLLNNKIVIERQREQIKLRGNITPKLSPTQSVVDIFNLEEEIFPAKDGLMRIFSSIQNDLVSSNFKFPWLEDQLIDSDLHILKVANLST